MAPVAARPPTDDDIDVDLGENYYKGSRELEERWTGEIIETIRRGLDKRYADGRRPALRDAHAFDNGCIKAIFRIDTDLKRELQHGLFVPGHEYQAWIRFSNGNSEQKSKLIPDARGMAIKLTGVPGDKLLGDERNTHDIILISNPAFFVDDLERYKATLEAFLRGGLWDQFVVALLKLRPREILRALRVNVLWISNPLFHQYWSMTPYRLGTTAPNRTAVKYTAKPRVGNRPPFLSRLLTYLGWGFSLKQEMNDALERTEVYFDFYVQRYVDSRTPIEDSKVVWSEDVSPPEHVAKIVIPSQNIMSRDQALFCENLSFNPWNCLPAHKPLGLVNRVRRTVYRNISAYRHNLNRTPKTEPTGNETFL